MESLPWKVIMPYDIHDDIKYPPGEVIEAGALARACAQKWWNQALCRVNDCVVRLGVLEGEFHWHHHDAEDELFFVLEGRLVVDLENKTIELAPGEGVVVPRFVEHRTRAPGRTVVLMVEGATVTATGD